MGFTSRLLSTLRLSKEVQEEISTIKPDGVWEEIEALKKTNKDIMYRFKQISNAVSGRETTTPEPIPQPVKAFTSAIGAGKDTTGGRGGTVIHVTTLADDGRTNIIAGSLREALLTQSTRIIVFDVSGQINLTDLLEIPVGASNYTVAGQTAPEGGITITGRPIQHGGGYYISPQVCDNAIWRYVRFRNGSYTGVSDVYFHNGFISKGTDGLVFDHCSFSFCDDQALSMDSNYGVLQNVTVQNCLFSENATCTITGLQGASDRGDMTFAKNLYVHQSYRVPNIGGNLQWDILNNVMFNFTQRLINSNNGNPDINYIGNYVRRGTYSTDNSPNKVQNGAPVIYTANNYHDGLRTTPILNDQIMWAVFSDNVPLAGSFFTTTQHPLLGSPTVLTALDAYTEVIADSGTNKNLNLDGTINLYQDTYDTERVNDVVTSTSRDPFNKTWVQPTIPNNTRAAGYDTSGDGMPDVWKTAQGLNPATDDSSYDWGNGYIGCEQYLNEIDTGVISPDVELYTVSNVVSLEPNETIDLTGITESGLGTMSVVSGGAQDGRYYVKLEGTDVTNSRIEIVWDGLVVGNDYTMSFYARKVGTTTPYVNGWTSLIATDGITVADPREGGNTGNITSTSWTLYSYDVQATATNGIARFFIANAGVTEVHVDSFSIILLQDNS